MKEGEICALIEEGCQFEGNLSLNGTARIAGKVKGFIYSNDTLIISEGAFVDAEIVGHTILISGTVKGEVKASSRVEMKRPARFEGNVICPNLTVEEGVVFHGTTLMKKHA